VFTVALSGTQQGKPASRGSEPRHLPETPLTRLTILRWTPASSAKCDKTPTAGNKNFCCR
jgi:hypothetical protein